ncbi:MAG TPA: ergothioneine biosynthesis protein EgtB [candidate division Zixibacteria bacterium]|nr:ergothioneine biosynthesis protein EgtB [candidate division Zixibacteria bacterium]
MSTIVTPKHTATSSTAARYLQVRRATLQLTETLNADDMMVQAMPDASPTKWHMAHTTWFFETFLLSEFLPGYRPFRPEFRQVFNSYYKQVGAHPVRMTRGNFSRPTLQQVLDYREQVDSCMLQLLDRADQRMVDLIELGLHHEQQHQELIVTDVLFAFWSQPLRPAYVEGPPPQNAAAPALRFVDFGGGEVSMGHAGEGFCFDNETPRHRLLLAPYRLATRLVTNAEYLDFINDKGYRRPELWLSDGWDTVCQQQWSAPLYWEQHDGQWLTFGAYGVRPLDPHAPVCHVSYYEADAFARWTQARLPLEAEWEHAAYGVPVKGNFVESRCYAPRSAPVGTNVPQQLYGDCWEWTASPYVGYPGFRPNPGALGEYNGKFMCNQFVLRGGSCGTPQNHIRPTYRNFFPPHARWQFMGIRLAS